MPSLSALSYVWRKIIFMLSLLFKFIYLFIFCIFRNDPYQILQEDVLKSTQSSQHAKIYISLPMYLHLKLNYN
ncbi:hypothetical protein BDV35DRAFT_20490 [Aspergillus flavus]|uniref:Uncharacterized protein n=1 Tax=Aspergillus flavus TaxID=5059 RepID=A0A5N6GKY9_ASPFL|nr:hypothetical protein BDV35DRAFT_20490 [Aspergillus flavus]